jgi:hypothetical protein
MGTCFARDTEGHTGTWSLLACATRARVLSKVLDKLPSFINVMSGFAVCMVCLCTIYERVES